MGDRISHGAESVWIDNDEIMVEDTRSSALLTEIRDLLIEIRDRLPSGKVP